MTLQPAAGGHRFAGRIERSASPSIFFPSLDSAAGTCRRGNRIRCSYLLCSWVTATWAPRVQAPHAVTQLHGGQLQRSLVRRRRAPEEGSFACTISTYLLGPFSGVKNADYYIFQYGSEYTSKQTILLRINPVLTVDGPL